MGNACLAITILNALVWRRLRIITSRLSKTATKVVVDWHATTKPLSYWKVYDEYLPRRRRTRFDLVEVGVFTGESLKVFARHYPRARVLGIDAHLRDIDFSLYPNVEYVQGDQGDREAMKQLVRDFSGAPHVVLDDASHLGGHTLATFEPLYPTVAPGGIYIIEDWGTGYRPSGWKDGAAPRPRGPAVLDAQRFPSHDFGMVGAMKSLIDGIGPAEGIDSMHFHQWTVVIRKSA